MRLLKVDNHKELSLTDDLVNNIPPYAILSHTWGADHHEVTFDDVKHSCGKSKVGYTKLQFCREQAMKDALEYIWVDTCCINKQSSAELSEAINSMYGWYKRAERCFVYLQDVEAEKGMDSFRGSKWFTRGWTLQELIAPPAASFYDRKWQYFDDRTNLSADEDAFPF